MFSKFTVTICALILIPFVSHAKAPPDLSPSLSKISDRIGMWARETQGVQSVGLRAVLETRCAHYLTSHFRNPVLQHRVGFECVLGTMTFMSVLKPTIVKFAHPLSGEKMALQVAFPAELGRLTFEPAVAAFFKEWLAGLDRSALGIEPLDTFTLAERFAGSEKAALKWMAILFQDTSEAKVQIQWLKRKFIEPSEEQMRVIALFEKVIDQSILLLEGKFTARAGVTFYPARAPGIAAAKLGVRIYHYYVPAYLALRMNAAGRSKIASFFEPFLFNYLYEAIEESNPVLRVFSEPRQMRAGLGDSYLGYLGAFYGANINMPLLSREEFFVTMKMPARGLRKISSQVLKHHRLD